MNAAVRYATVQAEAGEPELLLADLHARVLLDLKEARHQLLAGRVGRARDALQHARRVLLLLNRTLDPHADPHLAGDLRAVYLWAIERLDDGDLDAIGQVGTVAARLARAWALHATQC